MRCASAGGFLCNLVQLSFVPQRCPNFRFIILNPDCKEDVVVCWFSYLNALVWIGFAEHTFLYPLQFPVFRNWGEWMCVKVWAMSTYGANPRWGQWRLERQDSRRKLHSLRFLCIELLLLEIKLLVITELHGNGGYPGQHLLWRFSISIKWYWLSGVRSWQVKIDTEKYPNLATRFNVYALPTLVLFENGKEVDRIVSWMQHKV